MPAETERVSPECKKLRIVETPGIRRNPGNIAMRTGRKKQKYPRKKTDTPEKETSVEVRITQQRGALKDPDSFEEGFNTLFEASSEFYFLYDLKGNIKNGNKVAMEAVGYDKKELKDRNLFKIGLLAPSHVQKAEANLALNVSGRPTGPEVFELRRKNGGKILMEIRTIPLKLGGESLVLGIGTDVTARRLSEEKLRESEEKLRIVIDNVSDVIFQLSPSGYIQYLSPNVENLYGYKKEDLEGRHLSKTTPTTEIPKSLKALAAVMSGEKVKNLEINQVDASGKIIPMEINAAPVERNGKIIAAQGIMRNISSRKVADERERKYAANLMLLSETAMHLVQLSPDQDVFQQIAIQLKRFDDILVSITNEYDEQTDSLVCRAFIGPERKLGKVFQLLGMNPVGTAFRFSSEETRKKLLSGDLELVRGGLYELSFGKVPRKVGDLVEKLLDVGEIYGMGLVDKNRLYGSALVILKKEATINPRIIATFGNQASVVLQKRMAEKGRSTLEEQLRQSQKMEAIGQLAGGVAHDFNNLLSTIQGYTELTLMNTDESEITCRNMRKVLKSTMRAAALTRQLLLFSRRQPMEFSTIDISMTVRNLLEMLRRLLGEDIVINTEREPLSWTIQADEGNIEQILMNLAVNARDAMNEGGKLTIKTENTFLDEKMCKFLPEAKPGRFVCLTVEDTGHGMDDDVLQRIFEPFFSTKGVGKGTGLGLSVVYGIVKEHGGWINVNSEKGQGTRFRIYLPAARGKAEIKTNEKVSLNGLFGKGERILLVEDEDAVRDLAAEILGEKGYVIVCAATAEEALEIHDADKDGFDLIFSDVVLPGRSALSMIEDLRKLNPALRVLFSSGYTDDKSQWPAIRESGFPFLQKPYSLVDLLKAVKLGLHKV